MKNLQFDKLKFIEYVIAESISDSSNKENILATPEVQGLLNFFNINYDELVVLSLLIEGGIRQEEQGVDSFLEHFGGGISSLKNINDALQGLISKGYVIAHTKNRLSKTPRALP